MNWRDPSEYPEQNKPVLLWGQFVRPECGGPEPLVGQWSPESGWVAPDTQTGGYYGGYDPIAWTGIVPPDGAELPTLNR